MLEKLTDKVYYMPADIEADRPVLGLICGEKACLAVDAGASPRHAKEFLAAAEAITKVPVKYVALTHWHWDHIFGLPAMNMTSICHYKTQELLAEMRLQGWDNASMEERVKSGEIIEFTRDCIKAEMPDESERIIMDCEILIDNKLQIDLGGVTCIIEGIAGDHTDDSTIVYIPGENVMFLGDCVYGRKYNREYGYTRDGFIPMVDKIRRYEVDYYLISHLALEKKEEVEKFFDELIAILNLGENEIDSDTLTQRFISTFNREPSKEEAFYISCCTNVNKGKLKSKD